jgi:hypothetical protein
MDELAALGRTIDVAEWRRIGLGLVLRSLGRIVTYALGGFLLFGIVALLTELALVEGGWVRVLYVPYLLFGAFLGASMGLTAALRRESRRIADGSTGLLGPLVERAVDELGIPEEGIEVDRLRALAELEGVVPAFDSRIGRAFAGFAVARALDQAGMRAMREQALQAVREAEARGDRVVTAAAVRDAARTGFAAALVEQVDAGWRGNRAALRLVAALALLSLPILAGLFG